MSGQTAYERGEKFLRALRLWEILQTTQVGKTTRELADDLEVDVRSVQRYIGQLRAVNVDVECDERKRYRIGEATRLPPLQFTKAEGIAVLVALRLLQQMRPGRDAAVIGAVGRLAGAMRLSPVTAYLGTMARDLEERHESGERERIEGVVVQCFADRIPCEIDYRNADGVDSRRVIETYFLEPRPESRAIHVHCFDHMTRTMRWFRLDRIHAARAVKAMGMYTVPDDFDIGEVTRSSWGIWQAGDVLDEVVLRFQAGIVERVREAVRRDSARFVDLPDGGVEMRVHVASEKEMRPWVLSWGANVEVIGPPSLREHAAASARESARMYDGHVSPG